MIDEKTIAIYDAKAQKYASLITRETPDADLQAFIDAVAPGGTVLDLGCGPGNSAAMMRDAGLQVRAMDASAEMVKLAADTYGIPAVHGTFDDLSDDAVYDGIWANFSLLHAPKADMLRHLAAIHKALKSGGVFHIGIKLGTDEARDSIGRMYSYYQEDELINLLKSAGLTPRAPRFGEGTGLDGSVAKYIILLSDA